MAKTLSGKVALVTGGSRGIGAAIARALAEDGADVAISYSASADKAKAVVNDLLAKGVRAHAFKADQANTKEVEGLVKSVVERFGRLDILVNNAGVFAMGQVHDRANNLDELDHLFAVNVGGVAAAVRTAAPLMEEAAASSRSARSWATPRLGQALPTIRPQRAPSPPIPAAGLVIWVPRASPSIMSSRVPLIPT